MARINLRMLQRALEADNAPAPTKLGQVRVLLVQTLEDYMNQQKRIEDVAPVNSYLIEVPLVSVKYCDGSGTWYEWEMM